MKENKNLPRYCIFFIKEIQDSIDEYDITGVGDEIAIDIETYAHPYDANGVNAIIKTFERKDYSVKMQKYQIKKIDGEEVYSYLWNVIKQCSKEDLPF